MPVLSIYNFGYYAGSPVHVWLDLEPPDIRLTSLLQSMTIGLDFANS